MRRGRQRGPAPLIFAKPPSPVFRRIWHLDIELPVRPVAVASSGRFPPPLWMSAPAARDEKTNAGPTRPLSKGFCGFPPRETTPRPPVPSFPTETPRRKPRSNRPVRSPQKVNRGRTALGFSEGPRNQNEQSDVCTLGHPMHRRMPKNCAQTRRSLLASGPRQSWAQMNPVLAAHETRPVMPSQGS